MGPTKIMIIRHAEKPGIYDKVLYNGINPQGQQDPASLVTMGWERAGGIASLFYGLPPANAITPGLLATPTYLYASDPSELATQRIDPKGNIVTDDASQRPYQTISALYAKMTLPPGPGGVPPVPVNHNMSFAAGDYINMVGSVLALDSGSPNTPLPVLIAWQHQDILPRPTDKPPVTDSLLGEFLGQSGTRGANALANIPPGPWPPERYDMVFVLDRPSGTGPFTLFTQVPQMLLAGDLTTNIVNQNS